MDALKSIKSGNIKNDVNRSSKFLNLNNSLIIVTILILFWIVAFYIQPFLHYHTQQIAFNTGVDFLIGFLDSPGGISNYVSLFLSQFFSFNLLGSIIIVMLVSAQGLIAVSLADRLFGKSKLSFFIFSVVLVFGVMVFCDYRYPFKASVQLLFAYVFVWIYSFISTKRWMVNLVLWIILSLSTFYVANDLALIIFAFSSVLMVINHKPQKWLIITVLMLLIAAILPYLSYLFIFPLSPYTLYSITKLTPPESISYVTFYLLYCYYFLLPAIIILLIISKEYNARTQPKGGKVTKGFTPNKYTKRINLFYASQIVLILLIGFVLYKISKDDLRKKLIYIEYHAENRNWEKVLEYAEKTGDYNLLVNFQVNRAYANLGQLSEKLFNYPQLYGSGGLFIDNTDLKESFSMQLSDFYFDLGLMSESLRWAYETQTLNPYSPRVLKRLVSIYLVDEKYELAEKFLNVLDKNILYREWVNRYRKHIKDNSLSNADPVIAEKRRFNPHYKTVNYDPRMNLKLLLLANKDNKLAYEYYLALSILDVNYSEFITYLKNYTYYNIKTLPESWEETLCLYMYRNEKPDFVTSSTISSQCIENFKVFNSVMRNFDNNREKARNALQRDFGNTFWYYLLYIYPNTKNNI